MACQPEIRKIAFVGDYMPRRCGIATFTHDLVQAVVSHDPETECTVVAVNDQREGYEYPPEVRFEIAEQELDGYHREADFLNLSNVDMVCLQHEFGIYGGTAGSHVLALMKDLRMPVVTTLHTVLLEPNADQRRVMQQLAQLSARLVVMSDRGKRILREVYNIPPEKIDVIAHGIPDMPFVDPNFFKDKFHVEGKNVLLTFGLLSPNKGIEYALKALPQVLRDFPDTVYIVLGATHPSLVREQGENYRHSLERMTRDLGIKKNVAFYNRFVELHELIEFIGAADIYITPYLNPAQITSGTLAYSFGCGKAVISTPYWHAEELLAEERGVLVPFGDSDAIASQICSLLHDETRRHAMRKRAYLLGREMIWENVGGLYIATFQKARLSAVQTARRRPVIRTLDERRLELPHVRLDHLLRMSDSCGIFQHAIYAIPNFREGYCTDDNARALTAMVMLEELGLDGPEVQQAAVAYAAFLEFAYNADTGRFRNFLNFDRSWAEEDGSDDSQGRAVWGLGTCVGRSRYPRLQFWAVRLFEGALNAVLATKALRTSAFALLGVHEYLRRLSGDRHANQVRDELTQRLIAAFHDTAADDWPWFENVVAYDNAKISHALILSGRWSGHQEALDIGLRSLRWLCQVQHAPKDFFRPIGSNGFYPRGQSPAELDQQPIEAHAMVSACIEAFRTTEDEYWLDEARLCFEWFLGRNHLGIPLYNSATGGCCDGLHADRVNQNQGAESTLAFLLSLVEMRLLEASLAAFDKATNGTNGNHLHPRPLRPTPPLATFPVANWHNGLCHAAPPTPPEAPTTLEVRRTGIILRPNNSRVLCRPFELSDSQRCLKIIARVMEMPGTMVEDLLSQVLGEFHGRHQRAVNFFLDRFEAVKEHLLTDSPVDERRRMLIGAYFTQEYSLESAALFNPSMVWHPYQGGVPEGSRRFVLSLRATGEGHISSLCFRSGLVDANGQIVVDRPTGFVTAPQVVPNSEYDKALFLRKLSELGIDDGVVELAIHPLGDTFTMEQLEANVRIAMRQNPARRREWDPVAKAVLALAKSNYEIQCDHEGDISERIIFPYSPTEMNGIEDARWVEFFEDDGRHQYYATYTAFDGNVIFSQLIETADFLRFKINTLNGSEIRNKGMALFPRKINGHYAMLSRQDGENIFLMYSDMLHFWSAKQLLVKPTYSWEFVQLGNCGSPIETEAGWLVLSHGVGPMRKYSIGAFLLDRDDPSRVIGRLKEPLLTADENERAGYVPNVVYSCGGQVHNGLLIIPYAMSDFASTFATVPLDQLLAALRS